MSEQERTNDLPEAWSVDKPGNWARLALGAITSDVTPGFSSGVHVASLGGLAHLRPMNVTTSGEISLENLVYVPHGVSDLRARKGDVILTIPTALSWLARRPS
jgi:hypothetical protein